MTTDAKLTVIEALSAVMEDVQAVKKGDRNTQQNFNFRGIDAVVNAVGPALRKHGVVVVPTGTSWESERYQTKSGAQMRGVTLTVSFRFYGPAGDFIDAQASGESSDSGDKAMPKAHSVAYRTLLLQALCIPTDEPDPDAQSHERAGFVDTGEPADFVIHFGKNAGKRLGELSGASLSWYAETWESKQPSEQDVALKAAARALAEAA